MSKFAPTPAELRARRDETNSSVFDAKRELRRGKLLAEIDGIRKDPWSSQQMVRLLDVVEDMLRNPL